MVSSLPSLEYIFYGGVVIFCQGKQSTATSSSSAGESLLFISVFIGLIELSMGDSINKLGMILMVLGTVGEKSCGRTG